MSLERSPTSPADRLDAAMTRYAGGDDGAFPEIYNRTAPRLVSLLLRSCGDRALAEDLTHETLMRLHSHRSDYRLGSPVIGWAYSIARRLYIDHWRKMRSERERLTSQQGYLLRDPLPPADRLLEQKQLAGVVDAAISALPSNHGLMCRFLRDEELMPSEIAEILDIPPNTARVRAHRAQRALREVLAWEHA
jgi:RNA polymerase sigma-70 factor (ECF subfamily)